jgi:hypothetical protein
MLNIIKSNKIAITGVCSITMYIYSNPWLPGNEKTVLFEEWMSPSSTYVLLFLCLRNGMTE